MLITLHVVCTLNTQLKLLPFKRYTVLRQVLRQPVNGNFNLTPTVGVGVLLIRKSFKQPMFKFRCVLNMCNSVLLWVPHLTH